MNDILKKIINIEERAQHIIESAKEEEEKLEEDLEKQLKTLKV